MGSGAGRLHVYLGAVPGAGKTYAMLAEGSRLAAGGADVVVALAETHGRGDLDEVMAGLEVIPRRGIAYRGTSFGELDTDAVLARHPDVVLVDELAHSNVPGSRRDKRWQDVEELLRAGIDVVTTLNVQHVAGLHDVVEQVTGVPQREFEPDAVVLAADRVDFVDAEPRVVLKRLSRERAAASGRGFFDPGRMEALRQLALTWLGERDLSPAPSGRAAEATQAPVVVALAPGAPAGQAVRRAAELAALRRAPLVGVCVRDTSRIGAAVSRRSQDLERTLAEFGGRYAEVGGTDIALELARFAQREHAGVLVIGDTSHSAGRRLVHGSIARRTLRHIGPVEVYVVPPYTSGRGAAPQAGERAAAGEPVRLPARRRLTAWALAVVAPVALMAALAPARSAIGLSGALVCALLAVVAAALAGGSGPAILATVIAVGAADFFFTVPYYSLRVTNMIDVIALIVFGLVGAVIGVLVHVLASRAWQTAHSQAEADQLARLAADAVTEPPQPLAEFAAELRSIFDLDAVGVLAGGGNDWQVLAAAGGPPPARPEAAQFAAEIGPGRVLVMDGAALTAADARLLRVFASELLLARRRAEQKALESAAGQHEPPARPKPGPNGNRAPGAGRAATGISASN